MSEALEAVECGGCGRIVYLPAAWDLVAYLCLRCRAAPPARVELDTHATVDA